MNRTLLPGDMIDRFHFQGGDVVLKHIEIETSGYSCTVLCSVCPTAGGESIVLPKEFRYRYVNRNDETGRRFISRFCEDAITDSIAIDTEGPSLLPFERRLPHDPLDTIQIASLRSLSVLVVHLGAF
jgi:hypothetical protein